MQQKRKIKINGSINRSCEKCKKYRDCICFEVDDQHHTMCSECLFDIYGYGKPKRDKTLFGEYDLCKDCDGMTMKRLKGEEKVTDTHVIHKFSCDKCGREMIKKIKKWRK